jgi:hypothetical protein
MDAPHPVPPQLPPNTVVVNGAAANLLGQLTEGIRADMRAMEHRLSTEMANRAASHDRRHGEFEVRMVQEHGEFHRRLNELEVDDVDDDTKAAVAKARRDGQLSIIIWLRDNRLWLVPFASMLAGLVFGSALGSSL